jgi:hypothetical protein|tara:strand:- start:316 stop:552 length:237 start_codon:yes stop_codon:yes gene_type:complete
LLTVVRIGSAVTTSRPATRTATRNAWVNSGIVPCAAATASNAQNIRSYFNIASATAAAAMDIRGPTAGAAVGPSTSSI